ncbi:MAG: family 16 glycoside hydrolase, partial [Planctomycetota bacterium]
WYDKQACHKKRPEIWDRTNGRMYRISYGEPASTQRSTKLDVAALSDKRLVMMQLHKNDWHVRTSRRILQQRGGSPEVHRSLTAILRQNEDATRKLRALWALHATGGLTEQLAVEQLSSAEEYVRAWAIQLLLEDRNASAAVRKRLAEMARTEPSPVVRLYLASALQRLPHEDRWPIAEGLVTRAEDRSDHNLPLMIWYGVEPLVPTDPERALRLAASSRVPKVTRFIYRRMASGKNPNLVALVQVVAGFKAERQKLVVLDAMFTALKKRDKVAMPAGWQEVLAGLRNAKDVRLRERAITLTVIFGDLEPCPELRRLLADATAEARRRKWALDTLLRVKDKDLVPVLHHLVDDAVMCKAALTGLSRFGHPQTSRVILTRYPRLQLSEQRAAVRTLTSRASYAEALLGAILKKEVPSTVLDSATTRRQIARLKNKEVDRLLEAAWGRSATMPKDKRKLIDRYKKKLPWDVRLGANLSHGRAVYSKTCMACHQLFGTGGDLGPDITGSNRENLDYILENIIDPNTEVAKEYMLTTIETRDGGLFAGMVTEENDETLTLRNALETNVIKVRDIKERSKSASSVMPEGQLLALTDTEVVDLIGYLAALEQVPMLATSYNLDSFFNGNDLTGWDADPAVWSVNNGELVGKTAVGLKKNNFARSHMLLGDFRLTLEVKLVGNRGNSGIQFRSEEIEQGAMKGYQA